MPHLTPDFPHAIDTEVRLEHAADLAAEVHITVFPVVALDLRSLQAAGETMEDDDALVWMN
nr:hypothetical protein [Fulvimarina endophytica]